MQFCLIGHSPIHGVQVNVKADSPDMQEYAAWLQAIQNKYIEYLLENISQYKKMKKFEGKNPDIVRDIPGALLKNLKVCMFL